MLYISYPCTTSECVTLFLTISAHDPAYPQTLPHVALTNFTPCKTHHHHLPGELHGDMTQAARLESLEKFRAGSIAYLLATDVAARGLDIQGVQVRSSRYHALMGAVPGFAWFLPRSRHVTL
jgi:hypothetical protein